MTKKYNHIHCYERAVLGKYVVYKCNLPDCPHYVQKDLVIGRISICNKCGESFVMGKEAIALKYPRCPACKKGLNKQNIDKLKELLELGKIDDITNLEFLKSGEKEVQEEKVG